MYIEVNNYVYQQESKLLVNKKSLIIWADSHKAWHSFIYSNFSLDTVSLPIVFLFQL